MNGHGPPVRGADLRDARLGNAAVRDRTSAMRGLREAPQGNAGLRDAGAGDVA